MLSASVLVVGWLPNKPATLGELVTPSPPSAHHAPTALAPPSTEAEPAEARIVAQQGLRTALARLAALDARGARDWAVGDHARFAQLIADGERAYREQRFRAAQAKYAEALSAGDAMEARVPALIITWQGEGDAALAAGQSARAAAAYARVLRLEPGHAAARAGAARASTLDRVRALETQGEGYVQMGDREQARAAFTQALALDPLAPVATAGLARLDAARRDGALRDALATGYAALGRNDAGAARAAFERAAGIDPAAPEVNLARAEATRRAAANDIRLALGAARAAEHDERWSEAERHYQSALALDAELDAARDGKQRAAMRTRLDSALLAASERPAALIDEAARHEAQQALRTARAIAPIGTRLAAQIAAVDRALVGARAPVTVVLRSDGQAEVSITGQGALGRFTTRELRLAPGAYRLVTRCGDGREQAREMTIAPGAERSLVVTGCGKP
ncbi:MAG: tetratricopeptide repeat protein [Gammaproteobacteria bacterium]